MSRYRVKYWEKVSVWVQQDVEIECDHEPRNNEMEHLINQNGVDFRDSDYAWETLENIEYDFGTKFEVEEIQNG